MGTNSYVAGCGPFFKELLPYLNYPEGYYKGLNEGDLVYSLITESCVTRSQSQALAELLKVDIGLASTWIIKTDLLRNVDMIVFSDEDEELLDWNSRFVLEQYNMCILFAKHGWSLFFEPCS
jgi:hypothetical protein